MVGLVLVCHSNKLAEGILHELRMFAKSCPIAIAGGDDNDGYGTSYTKIKNAINNVYNNDGVCILADVGSSIMTTQMVLEELDSENIKLLDCPIVEGAIVAAISSEQGDDIDVIVEKTINIKSENKL